MTAAERLPLAVHTRHAPVARTTLPGDVAPLPLSDDAPGVELGEAARLALLATPDNTPDLRLLDEDDDAAWDELPRPADPYAAAALDLRGLGTTLALLRAAREAGDHHEAHALCGDAVRRLQYLAAYVTPSRAEQRRGG